MHYHTTVNKDVKISAKNKVADIKLIRFYNNAYLFLQLL